MRLRLLLTLSVQEGTIPYYKTHNHILATWGAYCGMILAPPAFIRRGLSAGGRCYYLYPYRTEVLCYGYFTATVTASEILYENQLW